MREHAITMTTEELAAVRRLAAGDTSAAYDAKAVFDRHIRAHVEGGRRSPEMNFLSEHFSVCPDFLLRSIYRKQVLSAQTEIPPRARP